MDKSLWKWSDISVIQKTENFHPYCSFNPILKTFYGDFLPTQFTWSVTRQKVIFWTQFRESRDNLLAWQRERERETCCLVSCGGHCISNIMRSSHGYCWHSRLDQILIWWCAWWTDGLIGGVYKLQLIIISSHFFVHTCASICQINWINRVEFRRRKNHLANQQIRRDSMASSLFLIYPSLQYMCTLKRLFLFSVGHTWKPLGSSIY